MKKISVILFFALPIAAFAQTSPFCADTHVEAEARRIVLVDYCIQPGGVVTSSSVLLDASSGDNRGKYCATVSCNTCGGVGGIIYNQVLARADSECCFRELKHKTGTALTSSYTCHTPIEVGYGLHTSDYVFNPPDLCTSEPGCGAEISSSSSDADESSSSGDGGSSSGGSSGSNGSSDSGGGIANICRATDDELVSIMADLIVDCTTGAMNSGNTHTYNIEYMPSESPLAPFCITGGCKYDSGSSSSEGGDEDSSSSSGVGYSSDSGDYPFGESCEIGDKDWGHMAGFGVFKRTLYPRLPSMQGKDNIYVSSCSCNGNDFVYCQLRNFGYVHDYLPYDISLCGYSHGYWCPGIENGSCDFSGSSAYIFHNDKNLGGSDWGTFNLANDYGIYPVGAQSSFLELRDEYGNRESLLFTHGFALPLNVSYSDLERAMLDALPDFPSLDKMHAYCRGEWIPHDDDCFGSQSEVYKAMGDSVFACGSLGGIPGYSLSLSGRGWCVESGCEFEDEASSSSAESSSSSSDASSSSEAESSSSSPVCYAYHPEWCGGLPLSEVAGNFSYTVVNQEAPACIFIGGMNSSGYINISGSRLVNGQAAYPHYNNSIIETIPKVDGGYYIYVPGFWNYTEISGAVPAAPACGNGNNDASSSSSSVCYAYQPEWCGGLPLSSVVKGFSSKTVNQGSSACVFIGGMNSGGFINITGSRKINGQYAYPHYNNSVLEAIPKADGGYYIYIPDWSYTDIYGAIPASPACGNDDEDEESEICSGGFLWDDDDDVNNSILYKKNVGGTIDETTEPYYEFPWREKEYLYDALGRKTETHPKTRRYLFSKKGIFPDNNISNAPFILRREAPVTINGKQCGVWGTHYGFVKNGHLYGGYTCRNVIAPILDDTTYITRDTTGVCGKNKNKIRIYGDVLIGISLGINKIYYVEEGDVIPGLYGVLGMNAVDKATEIQMCRHEVGHQRDNARIVPDRTMYLPVDVEGCGCGDAERKAKKILNAARKEKQKYYNDSMEKASDDYHDIHGDDGAPADAECSN
jgi:hypothetical protein